MPATGICEDGILGEMTFHSWAVICRPHSCSFYSGGNWVESPINIHLEHYFHKQKPNLNFNCYVFLLIVVSLPWSLSQGLTKCPDWLWTGVTGMCHFAQLMYFLQLSIYLTRHTFFLSQYLDYWSCGYVLLCPAHVLL